MQSQDTVATNDEERNLPSNCQPTTSLETLTTSKEVECPIKDSPSLSSLPPPDGGWDAWGTVFASFVVHFLSLGIIYSYGVYGAYYNSVHLDKLSVISFIGSVGAASLVGFGILSGRLAERFGFRIMIFIGNCILSLGLLLASFSTQSWQLMLTQGFMFGFGSSISYFPAVSVPSQWFDKRRGLATGLAVSGSGIGGLVFSLVFQKLIDAIGVAWTLRVSSIVAFVGITAVLPLVKTRIPAAPGSKTDWSILKEFRFLLLLGLMFFSTFPSFIPVIYLPTYAVNIVGTTAAEGAVLISIFNAASAVGRIIIGIGADSFLGRVNSVVLCSLIGTLSLFFIWTFSTSFSMLVAFAILNGLVIGGFISLFPVIVGTMFGIERLASIVGMLFSISAVGNLAGPPLAGIIRDALGYHGLTVFAGSLTFTALLFGIAVKFNQNSHLFAIV